MAGLFHLFNALMEDSMSRFASTLLASLFLLAASSASATGSSPASASEALRLFVRCDASLFNALKEKPNLFGTAVEVKKRGQAATIVVENPLAEKGRDQVFARPLDVDGVRLLAWHDEVSYDVELGAFLYWGFKAEGGINAVAEKINAFLPDSRKLVDEGNAWARSEIRTVGDPINSWRPSGTGTGTVAPKGSVERALMVDVDPTGQIYIYCTLQGSITPPLLQILRPDLTNDEYPQ
ncbi:MAG: hypothetical protein E2602_19165 [Achromobacter sp.]|nr:hypothetical protein [Achromobacter sp.]